MRRKENKMIVVPIIIIGGLALIYASIGVMIDEAYLDYKIKCKRKEENGN